MAPRPNPLTGRYANYFEVGHNPREVVLDFGHGDGPDDEPYLHTRMVMTPESACALATTLIECLRRDAGPRAPGDVS